MKPKRLLIACVVLAFSVLAFSAPKPDKSKPQTAAQQQSAGIQHADNRIGRLVKDRDTGVANFFCLLNHFLFAQVI